MTTNTYYSLFYPSTEVIGKKGTTKAAVPSAVVGGIQSDVDKLKDDIEGLQAGEGFDTTPPGNISSINLSSVLTTNGADLIVSFAGPDDSDIAGYDVQIKEGSGPFIGFVTTGSPYKVAARRNTSYTSQVRAFDKLGNKGAWSILAAHITVADNIAPANVTAISATTAYETAFLKWQNPGDSDLVRVDIKLFNTDNVLQRSVSVAVTPNSVGSLSLTNLTKATNYYVIIYAVDSSGNSASGTLSGVFTTASGIDVNDFTPGLSPVKTVASLPSAAGYTGPSTVYNQADGKLYTYSGGQWKLAGASSFAELAGTIQSQQIPLVGGGNLLKNTIFARGYSLGSQGFLPAGYAPYDNDARSDTTWQGVTGRQPGVQAIRTTWTANSTSKGFVSTNSGGVENANRTRAGLDYIVSFLARGTGSAIGRGVQLAFNYGPTDTFTPISQPNCSSDWQRYIFRLKWAVGSTVDPNIFITTQYDNTTIGAGSFDVTELKLEEGIVATAWSPSLSAGEITSDFLSDNALTLTKFASGLRPIETVSTLPAAGTVGRVVYLSLDQKLYRDTGAAWTKATDGGDISAGTITGNKLVAGTVSATEIAAGAVTASKLIVSDAAYLNRDPGFRDIAQWTNVGPPVNGPLGTSAGPGWYNHHGSDIDAAMGTTQYVMLWPDAYPVGAGRQHLFGNVEANIKGGTTYQLIVTARNASNQALGVYCRMLDLSKNFISDVALVVPASTGKQTYSTQFVAPDNVAFYQFIVFNDSGTNMTGNVQVTGLQVLEAAAATAIQDGAITTGKLTALAVTAEKVAAGAISADKIAANAVTTGKLSVQNRPVSTAGINIRMDTDGIVRWNAGTISYPDSSGNYVTKNIVAGAVSWNPAWYQPVNFCFDSNASSNASLGIYYTSDLPYYSSQIPLATWNSSGTNLVIKSGTATLINGGQILTNSIGADRILANSITSNQIAAGTITAAQIATGALTARVIALGNPDNVVTDGAFNDRDFWTAGNVADNRIQLVDLPFTYFSRGLQINPAGDIATSTRYFPVDLGASYKITVAVDLSSDFSGYFRPLIHMPGYRYQSLTRNATAALDGNDIDAFSTPGYSNTLNITVDNGVNPETKNWQFLFRGSWTGTVKFSVKIVRVSDTTLIRDGAITTDKITVGTLNGDRIQAGTLNADRIQANTTISQTILVSGAVDGATLGQTAERARDPAYRINSGLSTQIDPGRILISGGTSLSNWRQGGDETRIAGGQVSANTITANKLTIGNRGVTALGIDFSYNRLTGGLEWTSGYLFYNDDNNNPVAIPINAGSTGHVGSYTYIYYNKGNSNLGVGGDNWAAIMNDPNNIIMCTWISGYNFVANYGGTIVDGDRITTGSISATKMNVTSLSAISANIGLLRTAASGARMELENNQLRAYDSNGTLRVRLGVW